MPYGHLIAATVMTLGVCQGHSSTACFFSILTIASRGPSAIAELLVLTATSVLYSWTQRPLFVTDSHGPICAVWRSYTTFIAYACQMIRYVT